MGVIDRCHRWAIDGYDWQVSQCLTGVWHAIDWQVSVYAEPMMVAAAAVAADISSESHCQPHPLPMPAYGGYYAPLSQFLPTAGGNVPTPPYQRSVPSLTVIYAANSHTYYY